MCGRASVDTVPAVRLCGRNEGTEWAALNAHFGALSKLSAYEREGRERKSGEEIWESDGDRWEGEAGNWSDPADQMLINWAHCQLWVSSATVTLLHFTLFFSCSSSSYCSPLTSSASSFPHLFLFHATYIYPPLSFVSSHAFTQLPFSCKKQNKPSTFLLFFKHTALHWMSHSLSHYFQERRFFFKHLLFFLHVGAKRCFVSRGAQICFLMFHFLLKYAMSGYAWPCLQRENYTLSIQSLLWQ